jgi:peptidoglycan/LPS O-acetylase OafA/YrhL
MLRYRSDIDGLRAVAVVPVVLFHAGIRAFSGGFVGVDVFFVISGYLITKYVDEQVERNRFSLVEFYERRVRRIMPALFFLLIVSTVMAYFCLLPSDFADFCKSEIASTLFAPNILMWHQTGYFAAPAKLKPLLHLWSLGVEEQFYIFLPLTVMLAARWKRRGIIGVLAVISIASLAASIWAVKNYPDAAFYLVPFRAWELLLGSLISVGAFPKVSGVGLRNILAVVGLAMIGASVVLFSLDTPFPGLAAALPCIGAALSIHTNSEELTAAGKLLSTRLLVGIGLISYSLYLWHWSLLVFGEQFFGRPLTRIEITIAVLLAVVLATVSWRFVEQPFRHRTIGGTRPALFSMATIVAAGLILVAAIGVAGHGFPQRISAQAQQYESVRINLNKEPSVCSGPISYVGGGEWCRLGTTSASDFVVWGDSHARAIAPAFKQLATETGRSGWLATHHGCAPLLDVIVVSRDTSGCDKFNDAVISRIEQDDIRTVFLVGRWDSNVYGRNDIEVGLGLGSFFLMDANSKEKSLAENRAVFERGLQRTLARLARDHRNIVLLMDVPYTRVDVPTYLARSAARVQIQPDVRIPIQDYSSRFVSIDELLARVAQEWHASTVDPKVVLCNGANCLIAKDGQSIYRDWQHLSTYGASLIVDLIRPQFEEMRAGFQPADPPSSGSRHVEGLPKAHS